MDIHNRRERKEIAERLFKETDKIPKRSKKLFSQFILDKGRTEDYKPLTYEKYFKVFRQIYEKDILAQEIDTLTTDDVNKLRDTLKESNYSPTTQKNNFWKPLKVFMRWYKQKHSKDLDNNPELRRAIDFMLESKYKIQKKSVHEKGVLTSDEIKRLLEYTETDRDACLIMLLAETGARIGAVLNIKLTDIDKESWKHGYIVTFTDTKNDEGVRSVEIYKTVPYINKVLENHPYKNKESDSNAFLFTMSRYNTNVICSKCKTEQKKYYRSNGSSFPVKQCEKCNVHLQNNSYDAPKVVQLSYNATVKTLKTVAKNANISKKITPHTFRRTSASIKMLEEGWSEIEVKDYQGWSRQSTVPVTEYVKKRQSTISVMERVNDLTEHQRKEDALKPKTCLVCSEINSATNTYCVKCQRPLDTKTAIKEKEDADVLMKQVLQNPEVLMNLTKLAEQLKKQGEAAQAKEALK